MKKEILSGGMMVLFITTTMVAPPASAQTDNARPPIAIIYDASGSMDDPPPKGKDAFPKRIDAAREGVRGYGVKYTTDKDEFWYFQDCNKIEQKVLNFNKENPLFEATKGIEPDNKTPLYDSIEKVAKDNHDRGNSISIVLMTDGKDNCGGLANAGVDNACDFAQQLKERYQGIDLVVNPIGLWVDEETAEELACMAKVTGGVYTLVENPKDLEQAIGFAAGKKGKVVITGPDGDEMKGMRFKVKGIRSARGSVFLDKGTYTVDILASGYYPECGDRTTTVEVKEGETKEVSVVADKNDPCLDA